MTHPEKGNRRTLEFVERARAARDRMSPLELADYLAALHRPANTPTARGITPPRELVVCDLLDALRACLSSGTGARDA